MKEPFSIEFSWDCSSVVLGFSFPEDLKGFGWLVIN